MLNATYNISVTECMGLKCREIIGASLWSMSFSVAYCLSAWLGYMIRDHVKLQFNFSVIITVATLLYL